MPNRSFEFSHAIVRNPCHAIIDGLRAMDTGKPDFDLFTTHHSDYVTALRSTGAEVKVLPADEAFPDSVFVEDAALCLPDLAVIMRPGAPTRLGEAQAIQPHIEALYTNVARIEGPGFIEGGDILTTEREILVGLSERTDKAGVEELSAIVKPYGYSVRIVHTPPGVLHFKTDCSLLDAQTILSTKRLSASGCFERYQVLNTADGEEACANSIRFNNLVIMPSGFPKTKSILENAGYDVRTIGNTEAAKLDGGMSCLSLRFSPC